MSAPSLRTRIRNGILTMLALVVVLGIYTLPRLYSLGGAIRETLYRNYVSIEAAQHMHAAIRRLQVAELQGTAKDVLASSRAEFTHWMDVENHDYTETGEPALAHDIQSRGEKLFAEAAAGPPYASRSDDFEALHQRLNDLVAMNQAAMFRADSRSVRMSRRLAYDYTGGLIAVLLLGAAISWGLSYRLSKPLTELADRLRGVSQRKSQVRLGEQNLAELDAVASEFNQMAERLEQYDRLNIERIVYEKRKTEAIIESLEDGVVLIDPEGIVVHINEIASLILGLEAGEALGSAFDDLSSNHPHYLRVRDALRALRKSGSQDQRVEVQLRVRGRDHSYVLKPAVLHESAGRAMGTLLILQDVTFLRDQDRARTNLVATLSHELRTPLTSLALSAQLLERREPDMSVKSHELIAVILEECDRMKQMTANLLNLARGELGSITVKRECLDLAKIVAETADRFAIQAEERNVSILKRIDAVPEVLGDPLKLSWVVSNLIGNALRYSRQGGLIEIVLQCTAAAIRIEVADSGPGIDPELKDFIFERFTQYGADGSDRGSAGLGLAIAKDIVEAHGGRIFVESTPGRGSRFTVELPKSRGPYGFVADR